MATSCSSPCSWCPSSATSPCGCVFAVFTAWSPAARIARTSKGFCYTCMVNTITSQVCSGFFDILLKLPCSILAIIYFIYKFSIHNILLIIFRVFIAVLVLFIHHLCHYFNSHGGFVRSYVIHTSASFLSLQVQVDILSRSREQESNWTAGIFSFFLNGFK